MGRMINFLRYGQLISDEMMGDKPHLFSKPAKSPPSNAVENAKQATEKIEAAQTTEKKDIEKTKLEKDDYKAIFIAALQVFGPILLVVVLLGALFLFLFGRP